MNEQFTVRFAHVDAAGIMYFPRYFEVLTSKFDDSPLAHVPVAMRTDFVRPCHLGDRVSVEFDRHGGGWSFTGRIGTNDHFRVSSVATVPLHRRTARYVIESDPLGRWACGPDGRLHLSRCFEQVQIATEKFLESTVGFEHAEMHLQRKIGIPTAKLITRISELPSIGDAIAATVQVVAVGSKSFTLRHQLLRDEECLIENEQVIVLVSMRHDPLKSVGIPGEMRAVLEGLVDVAA